MTNIELRKIRLEKNMSIKEMSQYIGVSSSFYEKIEYGQRTPSYNFIRKFKSKFPKCNSDEIFLALKTTHNLCDKTIVA